eukprot:170099-Chlamydomonas_euryale.AAC.2
MTPCPPTSFTFSLLLPPRLLPPPLLPPLTFGVAVATAFVAAAVAAAAAADKGSSTSRWGRAPADPTRPLALGSCLNSSPGSNAAQCSSASCRWRRHRASSPAATTMARSSNTDAAAAPRNTRPRAARADKPSAASTPPRAFKCAGGAARHARARMQTRRRNVNRNRLQRSTFAATNVCSDQRLQRPTFAAINVCSDQRLQHADRQKGKAAPCATSSSTVQLPSRCKPRHAMWPTSVSLPSKCPVQCPTQGGGAARLSVRTGTARLWPFPTQRTRSKSAAPHDRGPVACNATAHNAQEGALRAERHHAAPTPQKFRPRKQARRCRSAQHAEGYRTSGNNPRGAAVERRKPRVAGQGSHAVSSSQCSASELPTSHDRPWP